MMEFFILVILFSLFCRKNLAFFPMSNYTREKFKNFREKLRESKSVLVITGAGLSNCKSVPTFESVSDFLRDANLKVFEDSPSTVWEYFQFKRNFVLHMMPGKKLAKFEKRCHDEGRKFTILTQNIDELHQKAGSKNVIELHGSIFRTKCTSCGEVRENYENPICPSSIVSIKTKDSPSAEIMVPHSELPRCRKYGCNGLLKPNVVSFNESLDSSMHESVGEAFENCDICLLIGTSPMISIAIEFVSKIQQKKITVAGFNIVEMSPKPLHEFYFSGPMTKMIEEALSM